MRAKCSHCNNGKISPYDYYGQVIGSGVCHWCDGESWIPYERFIRQVKRKRYDMPKLEGLEEISEEDRIKFKEWVESLGSKLNEEGSEE